VPVQNYIEEVRDLRTIPNELMRGVLASLEEHISLRLYWIMRDLRSINYELVRGHWASPRECVNLRLHWKM